jgi:hypothetical protein
MTAKTDRKIRLRAAKQTAREIRRAEIAERQAKRLKQKADRAQQMIDFRERWIEERKLGLSVKQIAVNSGVARSTVYRVLMPMADELKLRRNLNHRVVIDYATMAEWTRRYEELGETCRQIAETTPYGTQFIWSKLRAAGCRMRERSRDPAKKPGAVKRRATSVQGGNVSTPETGVRNTPSKRRSSSKTKSECESPDAERRSAA